MTMQSVDADAYKAMIKHVVFEENEVLMVIGPAGVGKTETTVQAAAENDAFYHPVLLGQYDTVDMKGTPWGDYLEPRIEGELASPDERKKFTVWHPASTLPFKGNPLFPTDRKILLHLDELTSATSSVFGICYQLIQERRVGEHILMDNVYIVGSGNRESDKGIVNRMPMPLCDRMVWCEFMASVKAWSLHAQSVGVAPECIAFINWRKPLLMTFDPAKPEKVFATGRSWVKAFKKFYASTTMPDAIKEAAMAGTVGGGPTTEFWGFIKHWQHVTTMVPKILKDPKGAPIPEELEIKYALAVNLAGEMDLSNEGVISTYIGRLPGDFQCMVWNLACAREAKLYKTNGFKDFSIKNMTIWR